jgi:hypothetical protein
MSRAHRNSLEELICLKGRLRGFNGNISYCINAIDPLPGPLYCVGAPITKLLCLMITAYSYSVLLRIVPGCQEVLFLEIPEYVGRHAAKARSIAMTQF